MRIRIVSPAGHCDENVIDAGVETLRRWGHSVTFGDHAKGSYGRYSGTVEDRVEDVISALKDSEVDVLYASRGGYGCVHLLDKIPLSLIREANKPIFGYSDITALHALWQKAGVRSVHAHMMKHLGQQPDSQSVIAVKHILENLSASDNNAFLEMIGQKFSGKFVGGNLSVMTALLGTPYDFDYSGKVLFLEDVNESDYKVDRMFYQLKYAGVFDRIEGLILGQGLIPFHHAENLKVADNAPIGHVDDNYPIIY